MATNNNNNSNNNYRKVVLKGPLYRVLPALIGTPVRIWKKVTLSQIIIYGITAFFSLIYLLEFHFFSGFGPNLFLVFMLFLVVYFSFFYRFGGVRGNTGLELALMSWDDWRSKIPAQTRARPISSAQIWQFYSPLHSSSSVASNDEKEKGAK